MADCVVAPKKGLEMMQGDSWPLEFKLKLNGQVLSAETVEKVELSVDGLHKIWPNGGLEHNPETGAFAFWPTQEESFALRGQINVQARAKLKDRGMLIGFDLGTIQMINSQSKEVL